MTTASDCTKYIFQNRSGGIVDSRVTAVPHHLFGIGHTAFVPPWRDPCLHVHEESEEFYLLLHGELDLYINGESVSLQPYELLMVLPEVPHAVIGGHGRIEYFGFRAPDRDDKKILGEIPAQIRRSGEMGREFKADWGCRIPLTAVENQNCWLIGWGAAKYPSRHLIFAYLNFPTLEAANTGIGTRLRMHYHQKSWEYYTVIRGKEILQIEKELINIEAGEILEVPPLVRHNLYRREAPYEGFTFRVPITSGSDKVEDEF